MKKYTIILSVVGIMMICLLLSGCSERLQENKRITYWPETQETQISEYDDCFTVIDRGTLHDAPYGTERTPVQRALLHLISREVVEEYGENETIE